MWAFLGLVYFCLYVFYVFLWVRVVQKAGLGLWGLLAIIPPLTFILLIVLAFSEWQVPQKTVQPSNTPHQP